VGRCIKGLVLSAACDAGACIAEMLILGFVGGLAWGEGVGTVGATSVPCSTLGGGVVTEANWDSFRGVTYGSGLAAGCMW